MTNLLKSGAVLGAMIALAVGAAATTASAAPSHPSVPWGKVRAGWSLDVWSPNPGGAAGEAPKGIKGRDRLYLVDPAGPRYELMTFAQKEYPRVDSWSGQRAVIILADKVVAADLRTGKTTTVTLPPEVTSSKDYLVVSPDGKRHVIGDSHGMELTTAAGRQIRTLATPRGWECRPTRFEGATVIASCTTGKPGQALWALPTSGAKATQLARTPDGTDQDYGDLDGVRIASGTYVESAGGCGYIWIGKVGTDGRNHPLDVPGASEGKSQYLLDTDGTRLLVQTSYACGDGGSLFWWNPETKATQWLLGPGANGGGVVQTLFRR